MTDDEIAEAALRELLKCRKLAVKLGINPELQKGKF